MSTVAPRRPLPFHFAVASALLAASCSPPSPPVAPSAVDAAMLERLIERIDALVAALGRTPGTAVPAVLTASPASERTPADAEASTLLARIEALERVVATQRASAAAPAAPVTLRHMIAPTRSETVQQVKAQLDNGNQRAEARRSLFLLTPTEVLDRFGSPTDTEMADNTLWWRWQADGEGNNLSIGFVNGVAMLF